MVYIKFVENLAFVSQTQRLANRFKVTDGLLRLFDVVHLAGRHIFPQMFHVFSDRR